MNYRFLCLVFCAVLATAGCNPAIGDGCSTTGDCSADGSRLCDTNQPGGYCTIFGCDPDTCPGEAACVEFRFDPGRTAETFCMRKCTGGCRGNYVCALPAQIPAEGIDAATFEPDSPNVDFPIARITDIQGSAEDVANTRICVASN